MSSTALIPQTKQQLGSTRKPQARFLVQSIKLEEAGPPKAMTLSMFIIVALMAFGVVWSMFATLDEVAKASGNVVPTGSIHVVQHLEGGIVREINVRSGQLVEEGDLLMRLSPERSEADLDQVLARNVTLSLEIERLSALIETRSPNFRAAVSGIDGVETIDELDALIADQRDLYDSTINNEIEQVQVLEAQILQQQAELSGFVAQGDALRSELASLEESLRIRRQLLADGLTSRLVVLDLERDFARTEGSLQESEDNITRAQAAINEVRTRLAELQSRLRSDALSSLAQARGERAETIEQLSGLSDRVQRLEVLAPLRGVIQGMEVSSVGAVVQPGAQIMEVVPADGLIEVEARILPRDRGHIDIGQPAEVRVSSFDFARFGSVAGVLTRISPSTFLDENQQPYYQVFVELEKNYVGPDPRFNQILPGMTAEVDVRTGQKTVFDYLARPVLRGLNSAFSER